jgi:hypothetical protein
MKIVWGVACSAALLGCGASAGPASPAAATGGPAGSTDATSPGHDHAGQAAPGAGASEKCDHLAHACHEHAAFSALTDECHKIGHGGDPAKCEARHDECMAECEKAAKSGSHAHAEGGADH